MNNHNLYVMASFLDDTKNFGLIVLIISVIGLISSVIGYLDNIMTLIGYVVYYAIMIVLGLSIFKGTTMGLNFMFPEGPKSKFGVVTAYIFATGLGNIVLGIFGLIGGSTGGIGTIVIGAIILLVGWIITNDKSTFLDKVIWIVLVILFALSALFGVFAIIGSFALGDILVIITALISSIASFLLSLMILLYLFDSSVKCKL